MSEIPPVLSADPGVARVGFGLVGRFGGSARLELVDYGQIITSADDDLNDRVRDIWRQFARLCRDYRPRLVGVENQAGAAIGARMKGLEAAARGEKAGGFNYHNDAVFEVVGAIKAAAFAYGIPVMLYAPQQAKTAVLGRGKGNAKKPEVMAAVRAIFRGAVEINGSPPLTEHSADAIAGGVHCERATWLEMRRAAKMRTA